MNNCSFIGKINTELTLRDSKPGKGDSYKVTTFYLLHQGGGKPQTILCEAWRGMAKSICRHKKQGQYIGLSGYIKKNEVTSEFYLVVDKINLMVETKGVKLKPKMSKKKIDAIFGGGEMPMGEF